MTLEEMHDAGEKWLISSSKRNVAVDIKALHRCMEVHCIRIYYALSEEGVWLFLISIGVRGELML